MLTFTTECWLVGERLCTPITCMRCHITNWNPLMRYFLLILEITKHLISSHSTKTLITMMFHMLLWPFSFWKISFLFSASFLHDCHMQHWKKRGQQRMIKIQILAMTWKLRRVHPLMVTIQALFLLHNA